MSEAPRIEVVRSDDPVAVGQLDDYFTSRELGFTTHSGGYRVVHPDPEAFVPPRGEFVVLRDEHGDPVGCGGVRRIADRDGEPCFEVKHVWLAPAVRGRGWGRLLMQRLEQDAAALGAAWIVLDTNETLTAAQNLYRSSGYQQVPAYNDNPNATAWFCKRVTTANRRNLP